MKASKTLLKILFVVFAALLCALVILFISSFVFMRIFNLPLEACRPWTIIQYFMMYRHAPDKAVRLAVHGCLFLPWIALVGVGIAILINRDKRALHGAARFANLGEVRQSGLIDPPGGLDKTILVGKYKNNYLTYAGYQFVLLAAPTRSGKGVGIVVPNCLNYSDSLVVLDIKGENFDITSGFRKACGQEVYLFSPYADDEKTHRYNPLDYISSSPAERLGDIDAIGQALYSGENNNDKFWSENAKDFFRGVTLFVLETPGLPHTLGEILRQASGKGKPVKEHLLGKLKEAQDAGHPYSNNCVDALNRVLSNSDNTLAGIIATFNTALLSFQNPKVDLATSASDFDLREVRRKRMSIYFKIEPTKLKDARVLINLFFDQLLNLNTRKLPSQDKTLKYQCLVLLDEMTSIGTVNMIKQAVSYMAGYNMRLLTIIQNKSQLEDVYGKAGAVTLLSNHALMIMYAPSPATQSDANEYSEMLGYETVKSKSKSHSKGGNSTSESDQKRALMLPQEIRELGKDNEIVTLENTKPIFCQKIKYYIDPAFRQRANWAVPEIPQQDVELFVAQMEQRIKTASASDLNETNAASRIVTGNTELPDDMKSVPDNQWSEDQVNCYIENLISNEIVKKSISNFEALDGISAASASAQTDVLRQMNSAAAPGTENARQILSDLTEEEADVSPTSESSTEDETSESSEESDSALLASLEEFSDDSDSENKVESIAIHADIEETHLSEITEQDTEPEETSAAAQNVTDITANITADVTADWDEKRCADFAASLISQIKLHLNEQKIPETTAQESIELEQKDEATGKEIPTSKNEGDKQKEYFRHVQKIRNAYRKVAKNPLASRRKIS